MKYNSSFRASIMMLLLTFTLLSVASATSDDAGTKTVTPDKKQTTTGFLQELTEIRLHTGKNRSGKEVYEYRCKGCHGKNTQGAPMPDDLYAWSTRLKESGLRLLLNHSINGYNNYLMPPKGGCRNCNEKEVYAAVFYMLKESGTTLSPKDEEIKQSLLGK